MWFLTCVEAGDWTGERSFKHSVFGKVMKAGESFNGLKHS
jgi:hypothetical protein